MENFNFCAVWTASHRTLEVMGVEMKIFEKVLEVENCLKT